MIRVYPSRLSPEPCEQHSHGWTTLRDWFARHVRGWREDADHPLTITINGRPATWDDEITPRDDVRIHVEPRDPATAGWIAAGILISTVASLVLTPKIRTPEVGQRQQGRSLASGGVAANVVRFNDPVPDISGIPPKHYPDYLTPPRRYYVNGTEQWVDLLLCVGRGEYALTSADVFIGDTPIDQFGDDAGLAVYPPGSDLSGIQQADWWHSVAEVGATTAGGGGLSFKGQEGEGRPTALPDGDTRFSGQTITLLGGRTVPAEWEVGDVLRVPVAYPVDVVLEDIMTTRVYGSTFFQAFTPTSGARLAIGGQVDRNITVTGYDPGQSGSGGAAADLRGNGAPSRLDFGVTPAEFLLSFDGETYSVRLLQDFLNTATAVASMNTQLASTLLRCVAVSGRVVFEERGTGGFRGGNISISGDYLDILGGGFTRTTGAPTTAAIAQSMLLYDSDFSFDIRSMVSGRQMMAIGPPGLLFRIVSKTSTSIAVTPYTATPAWLGWPNIVLSQREWPVTLSNVADPGPWLGPFACCPEGEVTDLIELNWLFTQGLGVYDERNNLLEHTVAIDIERRPAGSSDPWVRVQAVYTRATPDQFGITERLFVDPGRYEIRCRTSHRFIGGQALEDVQWEGMASYLGTKTSYPGVTLMGLRVRIGEKLAANAESKVWCRPERILPLIDGSGSTATRNPVRYVLQILSELGYPTSRLDMTSMESLHDLALARGDTFDAVFREATTAKAAMNTALGVLWAELAFDRGLLRSVRDEPKTTMQYVYSPDDLLEYPKITTRLPQPDDVDGVDVEYWDMTTGEWETIEYRLLGDEGVRAEKMRLVGVTDPIRAYRHAARRRRIRAYRDTQYELRTELSGLNSRYLSYDGLVDGIPGYTRSTLVASVETSGGDIIIQLLDAIDWTGLTPLVLGLRRRDGKHWGPVSATRVGENGVRIANPGWALDDGSAGWKATTVYLGTTSNYVAPIIVTKIRPDNEYRVSISAENYDARVYADDNWEPA